jgi:hypothetical protein
MGCSSDSGPAIASTSGTGGGGSSSGGASGSGGTKQAGGMTGSGGYDPALAKQCSIDSTGNECKICLAVLCCDAVVECFGDTTCDSEFSKYQTCVKDPTQVDPTGCFSTFTRSASSDGGKGSSLVTCIITDCPVCGGVGIL